MRQKQLKLQLLNEEQQKRMICSLYKLRISLLLLVLFIFSGLAQEDFVFHSELHWQTIETNNFKVHYHQGTERTANLVAKIAEEIYPHITGLYQYHPKDKTEFIIRDTDDYSNGGAYFFDNKVEIWSQNLDYILRGTHNWLRDVVTHEYTHIISMRKALKFGTNIPAGWLQFFGYEEERRKDVVRGFPDVLISYPVLGYTIPVWFAEGVSQFQSNSKRFDYRDSHREMILRDRVIHGKMLDLKEMSVFGKNSIGNESSYNQGFAFVNFLTKTFGDTIVSRLTEQASLLSSLTFDGILEKTTGVSADSLYQLWKINLEADYNQRLKTIREYKTVGESIEAEGIANIHPIYSPEGDKFAYIHGKSDYLSVNTLVVFDLNTGKQKNLAGPVSSSISWSSDGRYLLYCRNISLPPHWNFFNDLFIYDTHRKKEIPLTKKMRACNPDWSHDGKNVVFVSQGDGNTNLFILQLEEMDRLENNKKWKTCYYDINHHKIVNTIPPELNKDWELYFRKVEFFGKNIQQLTFFTDGQQIYHPRWSPDDSYILFDTSRNFCRDIAKISIQGGEMEFILNSVSDERYPVFAPNKQEIYFASDRSGIFNIYSFNLNTREIQAHTNVEGGAFMPTVNQKGDLIYALYQDQGYKIYQISNVNELPLEHLNYVENYQQNIPVIKANDNDYIPLESKSYKRGFGPVLIMPRILIDYGTVKPGFYVSSNEILDAMQFFGGADINKNKEYDLFSMFEFRSWKPAAVFFNFYNQSAKVADDYFDPDSFTISKDKVKVNFNLMAAELGLASKFRNSYNLKLTYTYSLYRAKIATFAYQELANPDQIWISPNIRYSYLKGHSVSFSVNRQEILPELDRGINPRNGYYFNFKITREWNKFLDDFATDRVIGLEIFKNYYFNKYEIDVERFFPVPGTDRHSLSLRLQGGYIDKPIDDFFNFFAGSLVGLKGYPYYSIEGRKMAIGTVSYRFPLVRNINFQFVNWYLDKIYVGGFYQIGDAWNEDIPNMSRFKSDIGFQLRLESFSWYMPAPIRIFFEAAYPLKDNQNREIEYQQEWKFYFGMLFDFNLRFENIRKVFR